MTRKNKAYGAKTPLADDQNRYLDPPKAGAWACYRYGWHYLKRYFLELLIVIIISLLAAIPGSLPFGIDVWDSESIVGVAYLFLLYLPLQYGVDYVSLKAVRNQKPYVGDVLEFLSNYLSVVFAQILVWLLASIGFLLLLVPGIIVMCKLAFVPYLVVYERLDALDAIRWSWRISRGYAWTVFRIGLLAILVYLLGLLALGVGFLISMIWVSLANAALYYRVAQESESIQRLRSMKQSFAGQASAQRPYRDRRNSDGDDDEEGLPNLLDR